MTDRLILLEVEKMCYLSINYAALLLLAILLPCMCKKTGKVALELDSILQNPDETEKASESEGNHTLEEAVMSLETKVKILESQLEAATDAISRMQLTSCKDALEKGFTQSGVYFLSSPVSYKGYCDMETDGGGWLVLQKRFDGSTDFYRKWVEYERGFGALSGEFWMGLKLMHELTSWQQQELRIDLENFNSTMVYAKYSTFSVGTPESHYRLTIGGYTGDAGDRMKYHNQLGFSTRDRDNDEWKNNCAVKRHGAWWYKHCFHSNLNGKYYGKESKANKSNRWNPVSRKRSEIKIRPVM